MKEHAWIKYYPWKDLYEKKIEPGFIPKAGVDHWDKKYCEAPDKIGVETKERYEKYLRNEATHEIFKGYYYFSIDEGTEKSNQSSQVAPVTLREKKSDKYINPKVNSGLQVSKETLEHSNSNVLMKVIDKSQPSQSFDSRISKLKKLSVSSSNPSLLKQYSQQSSNLSINSTNSGNSNNSNSVNASLNKHQKSFSTINLNNK